MTHPPAPTLLLAVLFAAVASGVTTACVTSSPDATPEGGAPVVFDAGDAAQNGDAAEQDTGCGEAGCAVTFVSGPDWPSYDGDLSGADAGLGAAKLVCPNASIPTNCPAGALQYGSGATGGWSASVSVATGAQWIWRGDTVPNRVSDLEFAVFQKTFTLGANPSGTIQVAGDDFVEVRVNGTTVGTNGSVTDNAAAYQGETVAKTLDLTAFLVPGENTITIVGQNGPLTFTPGGATACPTGCTFALNTAGVLFGGVLSSH